MRLPTYTHMYSMYTHSHTHTHSHTNTQRKLSSRYIIKCIHWRNVEEAIFYARNLSFWRQQCLKYSCLHFWSLPTMHQCPQISCDIRSFRTNDLNLQIISYSLCILSMSSGQTSSYSRKVFLYFFFTNCIYGILKHFAFSERPDNNS